MHKEFPGGVWPVMLTPFTGENKVDYHALGQLVEWYIENGVQGLFAVCQSSEMFCLSLEERVAVASFIQEKAAGRVPVIASGHVAGTLEAQAEELNAMAATGAEAIVLITNRLAKEEESDDVFWENLQALMAKLPEGLPLGFYECPYPYKRVLSPGLMQRCAETGRFYFHKDTCCDIAQITEKLKAIEGTNLKLYNANTTTLLPSLRQGAVGYSGVMANFHPELYVWLCKHYRREEAQELADELTIFSLIERQLYPVNAKYAVSLLGIDIQTKTRVKSDEDFTPTFAEEVKALMRLTAHLDKKYIEHTMEEER